MLGDYNRFWILCFRNPSTKNIKWTPVTNFPINYLRIGNCNLDTCDVNGKAMSAMESGFFERNSLFLDEFYTEKSVVVDNAKNEL